MFDFKMNAVFNQMKPLKEIRKDENMIYKMYSVKDELADNGGFAPPIPFGNEKLAIRYFDTIMEENAINRNNKIDFSLWFVGTYDTESATMLTVPNEIKLVKRGCDSNGTSNSL